jgi:LysR family glycine cleavage system transcriptional activator
MARLPNLKALHVFQLTAELGSMSRAAEQLSVSQSSVSRFIAILEDELGTALFVRRDGLSLTPAGHQLAAQLTEAFGQIERGVRQIRQRDPGLRVKVPPSLGLRWLLRQTAVPPGVRFVPRWHSISPQDEGFDIGIRYGLGDWPRERAVPVYGERLVPVCTPAYFQASGGGIRSLAQLPSLTLIHSDEDGQDWQRWLTAWAGQPVALSVDGALDTLDAAVQMALMDWGIAIADPLLVAAELSAGTLVLAHPDCYPSGEHYYLVHRLPDAGDPRVAALRDWLRERLPAQAPA